jgi:phage shock protein PspC (stress-responsive transcriptional regulator)
MIAAMEGVRSWFREQGLVRPTSGRWVAGVCRGVAERVGLPTVAVRALFVLSLLLPLPGSQLLAYGALWLLMPSGSAASAPGA